ncbi:MAG: M28 family peptidase, partial [bacterium]
VIGGHYDTVIDCPGANDNGTGVAATLALARAFANKKTARTLRFVAFVNEEPPYFQTPEMGSYVYAQKCRERNENVVAMLSLETIGYYTDAPQSQQYPLPLAAFFPPVGNFIAFVSNRRSRKLLKEVAKSFRKHTEFPFVDGAFPSMITGVGWSDQWAFWQHGYPGMMVTDTAPFRYLYYHTPDDTPDKIHFEHFTRLVTGLEGMLEDLVAISKD